MASWEQKTLADSGALSGIASTVDGILTPITTLTEAVTTILDAAKIFLVGPGDEIGILIQTAAQPLLNDLNDYKNLGFYYLLVNPVELNSKSQNTYGLEMLTDSEGRIIFKSSTVVNPDAPGAVRGKTFEVGDAYRSSLKLSDLSSQYRDRMGRNKDDTGFTPPIPKLVNPLKLVLGGYDPSTWTGEAEEVDPLPSLPAPECLQIMADAFDDKGDIPKFQAINRTKTYTKGPYTVEGSALAGYTPANDFRFHLYESANTSLSNSDRVQITKQIRAGKPNYAGSSVNVSALVILIASQSIDDFLTALGNMSNFMGSAFPSFQGVIDAYNELITPAKVIIKIDVNTKYGVFGQGDFIVGRTSGSVGLVEKVTEIGPTVKERKDIKVVNDEYGDVVGITEETINLNAKQIWKTYEIEYTPKFDLTNRFVPNEQVMEGQEYERQNTTSAVPTKYYRVKGEEYSAANYDGEVSDAQLPKYGVCLGIDAVAPNSIPPDFQSLTAAQMIPGWTDFFDGLIELANGLIGMAGDATAFLDSMIEALDDLQEYLEELLAKISLFLNFLKTGLPNAGIYLLPIKTNGGNDALKAAITSSTGAPDASYKFSAGVLLISTEINGIDPLEKLGGLLGLSFQSV